VPERHHLLARGPSAYGSDPDAIARPGRGLQLADREGKTSDACSGTNRTSIAVAKSGGSSFNSTWIHIVIPLGTSYGSNGLWGGGWWQIKYNVSAGNDTTTWSVNVKGNPVHLVPI
jgi:hypothetical protein